MKHSASDFFFKNNQIDAVVKICTIWDRNSVQTKLGRSKSDIWGIVWVVTLGEWILHCFVHGPEEIIESGAHARDKNHVFQITLRTFETTNGQIQKSIMFGLGGVALSLRKLTILRVVKWSAQIHPVVSKEFQPDVRASDTTWARGWKEEKGGGVCVWV